MNRINEINKQLEQVRNYIEVSMIELLKTKDGSDEVSFERPITVANNDEYDSPGHVYGVGVDLSGDGSHMYLSFITTWGYDSVLDSELFGIGDFMLEDLEYIYIRMVEEIN